MISKFSLRHAMVMVTLIVGGVVVADVAQAASAGQRRTAAASASISTVGLSQYNLGNGIRVYATPGVVFRSIQWNTGATTGSATNVGGVQ